MATETYELRAIGICGQQYGECVQHFTSDNVTANDTFVSGTSLINSWIASCLNAWLNMLPQDYSLMRLVARRVITKPSAEPHVQFQLGDHPGQVPSDAGGLQLCPVLFLIPPIGIKSGGKIFLPGAAQTDIVSNQYGAGLKAAMLAYGALIVANFGVSGVHWQSAILSSKLHTASLTAAYRISPRFGFQKRRRIPI